jgi:large subunit ribosomal protein L35
MIRSFVFRAWKGWCVVPKQKPHKGVLKRVRVTARGKVRHKRTNAGHLMSVKQSRRRRRFRRDKIMNNTMAKKVLGAIR